MCIICGTISHERADCPHVDQFMEIYRMADLAGYYVEVAFLNLKDEISITWRHNSYNPKNFCSGEEFLQMCKEKIEYREKQTAN